MTLYTEQSKNNNKTAFLMLCFLALVIAVGWALSYTYGAPEILYFAVIFSLIMNFSSYWFSDKIALSLAGAQQIEMKDNPEFWRVVENLCITAGLPMPRLYIINDRAPNAFATGRNKNHSAVAVTTGLLEILDRSELEGVIAHELAHIGNKDILLQSVVVVLVGLTAIISDMAFRARFFGGRSGGDSENKNGLLMLIGLVLMILSPIIATLIQLAISRKREFLADATGALITRYPEGLASALKKISGAYAVTGPMRRASNATAHMFISNPFGTQVGENAVKGMAKLFMTHPPVEERVRALLGKKMEEV